MFDLKRTAKGVALPGYSQHGDPIHTAFDVLNHEGLPTDEEQQKFAMTKEFKWLIKNAGQFGFTLSYPMGNSDGAIFEPWHWRYLN